MRPIWLLLGSLGFTLVFNIAWAVIRGIATPADALSVAAAAVCTLIVPAGLHLWPQIPAVTRWRRVLRALVMSGICVAATVTSFNHSVSVLLDSGWNLWTACSVTGGAELLVAISTMATMRQELRVEIADGVSVEGAVVRNRIRGLSPASVYRLLGQDDELLYVGITGNLRRRLAEHRAGKEWWSEVVDVEVETFSSRREALAAERAAIETEQPIFNRQEGRVVDSVSLADSRPAPAVNTNPGQKPEPVRTALSRSGPRPSRPVRKLSAVHPNRSEAFREWVSELGAIPSGKQIRDRFGIGYDKANALVAAYEREQAEAADGQLDEDAERAEGLSS